jgi:hypothetical protein
MSEEKSRESIPTDPLKLSTSREQRRHVRFRIDDASTSFSIKGVSTSLGSGRVARGRAAINLSEGGAMLLVCEPMTADTPVTVRIEIEGLPDFIEAAGVVRWCEQDGRNSKDFHAGIEFVGLEESDLRKISKIRERFLSHQSDSPGTNRAAE